MKTVLALIFSLAVAVVFTAHHLNHVYALIIIMQDSIDTQTRAIDSLARRLHETP